MLNVFKNFANSEKAVAVGLLIIAATVLTALGKLTVMQWIDYTEVMAGIYVGGKAIQGAASAVASSKTAVNAQAATAAATLATALATNDAAADATLADKFKSDESDGDASNG
jgi:hypothetical protein